MLHTTLGKVTLLTCGMFFCAIQGMDAKDTAEIAQGKDTVKTELRQKPNTAHWNIFLDAGGNYFDGDLGRDVNALYAPTVGLGFAYNFNTTWGIGAEYLYSMHRVTRDKNENLLLSGQMHRAQAFLTFDIFNVWRPYNPSKIFALNIIAGAGAGYYDFSTKKTNDATEFLPSKGFVPLLAAGVDFQFNVCKSLSLGVKGRYSYSIMNDGLDGRDARGTSNDGVFDVVFSMRYKISAKKKSHVLNEDSEVMKFNQLKDDVVDAVNPMIQNALANEERKRDTLVVLDTTILVKEKLETIDNHNNILYVYYGLNKSNLTDDALKVIQQAAAQLKADSTLYAEIIGYGDNIGSVEYNAKLTQERVDHVSDELISEHGIDSHRMIGYSGGIIKGLRSKSIYAPNRRVEIRFINKEEFNAISKKKASLEPTNTNVILENDTVSEQLPTEETKIIFEPQQEVVESQTVTIRKGMSLGSIARKHYGNALCWIYIYRENKHVIPDPDHLEEGQVLVLPKLTAQQLNAVKPKKR